MVMWFELAGFALFLLILMQRCSDGLGALPIGSEQRTALRTLNQFYRASKSVQSTPYSIEYARIQPRVCRCRNFVGQYFHSCSLSTPGKPRAQRLSRLSVTKRPTHCLAVNESHTSVDRWHTFHVGMSSCVPSMTESTGCK